MIWLDRGEGIRLGVGYGDGGGGAVKRCMCVPLFATSVRQLRTPMWRSDMGAIGISTVSTPSGSMMEHEYAWMSPPKK